MLWMFVAVYVLWAHAIDLLARVDLMPCVPRGGKESAVPPRAAVGNQNMPLICTRLFICAATSERPILFSIRFWEFHWYSPSTGTRLRRLGGYLLFTFSDAYIFF